MNLELVLMIVTAVLTILGIFLPNLSGIFDSILRLLGGL